MNHFRSIFAVPFVSVALVAGSALMAGCVASSEPDSAIDSAEEALVDESGALSIAVQSEVRLERANDGESLSLVPNAAWKQIAPGVFESDAQQGASRIVLGAEGHDWAIAQAEKELSGLRARASNAEEDLAASDAMQQLEEQLAKLKETAQNIAAGPAPQALSCNIGFYTGPSSPYTGSYGAAALAEVSCSGGCQTFTISAQACTNFGCSPVYSSSRFVCSTPWSYGVAKGGSYGASCSSAASVSPPGITSSWNGFCG
jgi:hypothetical protein